MNCLISWCCIDCSVWAVPMSFCCGGNSAADSLRAITLGQKYTTDGSLEDTVIWINGNKVSGFGKADCQVVESSSSLS